MATTTRHIPSIYAPRQTKPLAPRLDDDEILADATMVSLEHIEPDDPRLIEEDAMLLILGPTVPRVLCLWSDLTLAWVRLDPGLTVATALIAAYQVGRAHLERVFLMLGQAAGTA